MIFHQYKTESGCQSYLLGCPATHAAILIDPEIGLADDYLADTTRDGLRIRYLLDTHTHADHFSASRVLARQLDIPIVMHRNNRAAFIDMRVDDGETLIVGKLRLKILHTPGHTSDSMCVVCDDRVFTGDTLLVGGTGRTDLPSGDPEQLYDSLFSKLLHLDPALLVYPAHDYSGRGHSTLGEEVANNPRLKQRERAAFVAQMRALDLKMPTHLTESLRTNLSGGKTVAELINEAASQVSFMSIEEVRERLATGGADFLLLDVREQSAFDAGHLPGAVLIPRGQLELRVNQELPDPTRRIIVYCDFGKISTLATATLRAMGFSRAVALDGGAQAWRERGYPIETGLPE